MKLIVFSLLFSSNLYATNLICTAKQYTFDLATKKRTLDLKGKSLGNDIKLHIQNVNNPNINDDYLIILNKEHNITYPLKCIRKL